VVGPYGPGSFVAREMPPLALIRASLWVRRTRIAQGVEIVLQWLGRGSQAFTEWRGMEMFAGKTVRADDPRLKEVYANFEANLRDMLALARDAGVKSVVSTVAVDVRDSPPFASFHRPGFSRLELQRWQQAFDQGKIAAELGDEPKARASFAQALAIDPENANTHFLLARVLEKTGDIGEARRHYLDALQWDGLRFRADATINQIIRRIVQAAPAGSVMLADAAKALGSDAASTAAPAGHAFFFEHAHLTWEGNYALARLLAGRAATALFGDARPGKWLDSQDCANAIGFTAFGRVTMLRHMAQLTARPPFSGQLGFAANRERMEREISAATDALAASGGLPVAAGKIERAWKRNPAPFLLFHLAAVETAAGNFARALALNDRLKAAQPPSPEQTAQRAFLLQALGRTHEAETLLLESAARDPSYIQTYGLLGNLWAATGQSEKALKYFKACVARMPANRVARNSYARLLANAGNEAAAEMQWKTVLRGTPDDEGALAPLVLRLYRLNRVDEARVTMLHAYAYNPCNYENNARLEQLFQERGDIANTVKFMQAMADSGPVKPVMHADLAVLLSQLGRDEEAKIELVRARQAAQEDGDEALLQRITGLEQTINHG
jgi:tetratricopeptide (TPR) repeat protein